MTWRKYLLIAIALVSLLFHRTLRASLKQASVGQPSAKSTPDDAASASAFEAIIPVLHHPRCMNCHSTGDFPRQGDDNHQHTMNVRRGLVGQGVAGMKCSTCHQDHNLTGEHMPPGAPDWHLPSAQTPMTWQGLTNRQLCEGIKNPALNGHRTIDEIVQHMSTPLVLWGWHPGEGRTPVSMSQSEFLAKVKAWADHGAACPSESNESKPAQ
jgi:hypothetical protein